MTHSIMLNQIKASNMSSDYSFLSLSSLKQTSVYAVSTLTLCTLNTTTTSKKFSAFVTLDTKDIPELCGRLTSVFTGTLGAVFKAVLIW